MDKPAKILIVDDHQVVLDGLQLILGQADFCVVVGQASTGQQTIDFIKEHAVDVILLDINMPEMNGLKATQIIRTFNSSIKIIGLSVLDEISVIRQFKKSGANGYLLKNSGKEEILQAIREVLSSGSYYDSKLLDRLISEPAKINPAVPKLSRRETEILNLIVEEYTTKEIAEKTFISFGTVETHRRNIINKLGVRNTAGLVRVAMELGLLKGK